MSSCPLCSRGSLWPPTSPARCKGQISAGLHHEQEWHTRTPCFCCPSHQLSIHVPERMASHCCGRRGELGMMRCSHQLPHNLFSTWKPLHSSWKAKGCSRNIRRFKTSRCLPQPTELCRPALNRDTQQPSSCLAVALPCPLPELRKLKNKAK